ncbi:MAG TPA: DUF4345 domain-containing protein [Cyclobacteriaceae bacterium]|nr:DUF4345 domain-containing protein [Cyclobacteriaceae bacterium]
MNNAAPLLFSQRIVQVCLFLIAAIAISGGILQMYLGQPETSPRLDNIHRFMAGVYLSAGVLGWWAGITIRLHRMLPYFLALMAFMGGIGRIISITKVGIPEPAGLWIGYLVPELLLPCIIVAAQVATNRKLAELTS